MKVCKICEGYITITVKRHESDTATINGEHSENYQVRKGHQLSQFWFELVDYGDETYKWEDILEFPMSTFLAKFLKLNFECMKNRRLDLHKSNAKCNWLYFCA